MRVKKKLNWWKIHSIQCSTSLMKFFHFQLLFKFTFQRKILFSTVALQSEEQNIWFIYFNPIDSTDSNSFQMATTYIIIQWLYNNPVV